MNILSVENASFAIGHVALLDKTSFQLDSGEKVGLIGRNGAGKSSFLKILAGLQKLDDGQIIVQNNLKIVYVPQESFLIRTQPYLIPLPKVWAKFVIYCAVIIMSAMSWKMVRVRLC